MPHSMCLLQKCFDYLTFLQFCMKFYDLLPISVEKFNDRNCIESVVVPLLSNVQLCDSMNCSKPHFPILHYNLEFAQIHVH